MADPTLKDVLKAIAEMRGEMATSGGKDLRAELEAHRAETRAIGAMIEALRSDVGVHRAETKKGFEDLDKELTAHAGVHREIEKDIQALKGRAPRTAARAPRRPRTR